MIYLGNLRQMTDDMENWVIVRAPGSIKLDKGRRLHVPELSPSWELLGAFNQEKYTNSNLREWFNSVYVPRFIAEIALSVEARETIDRLSQEAVDKDIRLVCFCSDESMCHRSIIGGILKGAGAHIQCNEQYSKYFNMLMEHLR